MFPACSAQRAESPEPVSLEKQAPAPEQTAHPWPWALEQPHGQDGQSHSLLTEDTALPPRTEARGEVSQVPDTPWGLCSCVPFSKSLPILQVACPVFPPL